MSKQVYEQYKHYDQIFRKRHLKHPFVDSIKQFILPHIKGDILDIGTGDGFKISNLVASLPVGTVHSVTATEPSPLFSQAQKQINHPNKNILQLDWMDFFNTNERLFDTIISFEVIEHLDDQEKFVATIKSRLKPGGTFIFSTPNRPVYRFLCSITGERPDPTHLSERTAQELEKLLTRHFTAIRFKGFFPVMALLQYVPQLDILNKIFPFLWWSRTIYGVCL